MCEDTISLWMINWWEFLGDLSHCYSSTANKNTYLRVTKLLPLSFFKFFFFCLNNMRMVNKLVEEGSEWVGPLLNPCFCWFWVNVSFTHSSSKHTLCACSGCCWFCFQYLEWKEREVEVSHFQQMPRTLKTAALHKLFTRKDRWKNEDRQWGHFWRKKFMGFITLQLFHQFISISIFNW